ncbi:MAG TPA: GDSL-type esterase/lipase family protein [Baekduia sp.]|nr:GDSL-type esterase/lipase family protein [Baekduia sp.]
MPLLRRLRPTALRPALPAAAVALIACAAVPTAASARITAADATARVLVVGDSLAVGLKPSLGRLLGEDVAWEAKSGRTTPQGLFALRAALKVVKPQTVIVSLGTNDGPDPARFADRIDRVLTAIGPDACVVWSDIYRPARKGPYAALNGVLSHEAARVKRLHLVAWDTAVARRAVTLPDGLHPDQAGFAYRARMIARTVREGCGMKAIGDVVATPVGDATTGGVAPPG